jgi:hypothetical protein
VQLYGEVTSRPRFPIYTLEPIRKVYVNNFKAIGNCLWNLFLVCGTFCVEQAHKLIGASKL